MFRLLIIIEAFLMDKVIISYVESVQGYIVVKQVVTSFEKQGTILCCIVVV